MAEFATFFIEKKIEIFREKSIKIIVYFGNSYIQFAKIDAKGHSKTIFVIFLFFNIYIFSFSGIYLAKYA